jgi:hypothetical protein
MHLLEKEFFLDIQGVGYGKNANEPITIKIGDALQTVTFGPSIDQAKPVSLPFKLKNPANVIEIIVPHPTRLPNEDREVGIGLISMRSRFI